MWKKLDKNLFAVFVLFAAIQVGYLISEWQITGHLFGAPLDDVWIHFRFAENFAHGHFFAYNPGEPTPGTTSPLWVVLLSIPFLFSESFIIPFALGISSIFFFLALVQLYKVCVKLGFDLNYSLLTTILVLLTGRLLWSSLSGMEITLFTFLCLAIFRVQLSEIESGKLNVMNGLLLGLAAATRPETYLLAVIYYPLMFILLRKNLKQNLGRFGVSVILFLLLMLPYPIFSYMHTGHFLPNTYEGQVGSAKYIPNFQFLFETAKMFVRDNFITSILWLAAMFYFAYTVVKKKIDKKFLFLNLWIIALPLVSAFVASNWRHHGRYLIPLIPFINIAAINILQKIYSYLNSKNAAKYEYFRKGSLAVIFIVGITSALLFSKVLGWNVENINDQQLAIGKWIQTNLPNEKAFGINDIGAITFTTKKYVVDMAGLVTPEVFKFQGMAPKDGSRELLKLLKSKGVNYIVIYPDWFDFIMENYSSSFEKVYSRRLENNTICGGPEMFVYKVNWDKLKLD